MNEKSVSILFFVLVLASLVLAIVALYNGDNHGVTTGLIGVYGNLILSKIYQKD